ncbi:MAG: hypothetical protein RR584_03865, partial [Comamonas sp.]
MVNAAHDSTPSSEPAVATTTETAAPLISLRGICKHYGGAATGQPEVTVLRGIDLDIYAGEFVAVVGSS